MDALALAPFNGVGSFELNFDADAEDTPEFVRQLLLQGFDGGGSIESCSEVLLAEFNLDLKGVEIVDPVNYEHISRCEFLHAENDAFDL